MGYLQTVDLQVDSRNTSSYGQPKFKISSATPLSYHGALCLAQCQLDSSMPQVPGAGLLHLQSLFTVIETSQLGKAQLDSSIHSEDVPPD